MDEIVGVLTGVVLLLFVFVLVLVSVMVLVVVFASSVELVEGVVYVGEGVV